MKRKINLLIAALLILLAAFFLYKGFTKSDNRGRDAKEKSQRKMDAYIVTPSSLVSKITVTGSLLAFDEVDLKNEVAGRIVEVNLPEGKFVKKGTLLVKLFDDDLQATMEKLESQLAIQKRIYERQSELIRVNGISQNDYEQTLLQVNTIKADIAEEKALIRKMEVRAPFDGVIGLRNISVGAVVSPSTLLATIRTSGKLKLDFYVPEKYGAIITPGKNVKFAIYGEGKLYDATVIATERGIDNTTRNLKIRALITTLSEELIPGAFANVQLDLGKNNHALMIPTQAIIPQEGDKSVIVARNGKAHFVTIKTGIREASKIEVTAGLEPGDTIITSGILFLKENSELAYSSITKQP
ncbi:efflux RND transporter periplasmic adaptor subunit [uncultured Bacteroides sp.]|uniref:efflux RND transporter periplasmic adaptor subunit n=1 Tax=uncultured Bacteroides sp. TaxID=162156 RepID=UPI002AA71446|nr:efflux RND transporter periplasmic adaptor subunit [uncultured Bacteroides sp.]